MKGKVTMTNSALHPYVSSLYSNLKILDEICQSDRKDLAKVRLFLNNPDNICNLTESRLKQLNHNYHNTWARCNVIEDVVAGAYNTDYLSILNAYYQCLDSYADGKKSGFTFSPENGLLLLNL